MISCCAAKRLKSHTECRCIVYWWDTVRRQVPEKREIQSQARNTRLRWSFPKGVGSKRVRMTWHHPVLWPRSMSSMASLKRSTTLGLTGRSKCRKASCSTSFLGGKCGSEEVHGPSRSKKSSWTFYLSSCVAIYLSIYRSIHPSIQPSIHPSIHLSIHYFHIQNYIYCTL